MQTFCDKKANLVDYNLDHYSYKTKYNIQDLKSTSVLKEPHLVSMEPNGIPFTLYLISIKGKKYCIMYDERTKQKLSIKLRFNAELYQGTVFTGDLRKNTNHQWFYYIHDIRYYRGEICMNTLSNRLVLIYDILKNQYKWDEYMNVCQIKIRSYFLYEHVEKIQNEIVYFYPDKGNIVYKWSKQSNNALQKITTKQNMVAELHKTTKPDVYLIMYDNECIGNALIRSLKLSKELFHFMKNKEKCMVECKFNNRFQKWEPIKWFEYSGDHLQAEETVVEPGFEVPGYLME